MNGEGTLPVIPETVRVHLGAPDSAAIGEITLSKKAFDLPSDLSPDVFLSELENLK